jgi:diguanylate cyclase (GGDEF)-like protein
MRNVQIILNAILSKNIFEYILVDKELRVINASSSIKKYLSQDPLPGNDVVEYLPELVGSEDEVKKIFIKKYCLYTLESVHKNDYYVNISIEYCDQSTAIILLHNITAITLTKQNILQYSNESTLLYNTLQKVVDSQNALLFVTNSTKIEFANEKFMSYFEIDNLNDQKNAHASLYKKFSPEINSYDELFALVCEKEKQIRIGSDTFILQSTLVESTHKLFTLTKVTELSKEIDLDPLTGIYRKGYLNEFIERAIIEKRQFALIVLDLDNFKQVNDTYGHLTGDEVLREFVGLIKQHIRKDDFFARWGGEEFILLFENSNMEEAIMKIEKIRRFIETHNFESIGQITASFGLACIKENDNVNTIFARADKALYQAKAQGKNQVSYTE